MFKKGVELNEVAAFLRLKHNDAKISEKLTIIDPYIFSQSQFSIVEFMKTVFDDQFQQINVIEIITSNKKVNVKQRKDLIELLEKKCKKVIVKSSEDFHDRFWIVDEVKGFIIGTSINGIGRKHFFIQDDYLSPEDTQCILNLYNGKEND
jgi:hypothetical protein